MLRPFSVVARFLRLRAPGARERLTYRMLQALVVEPEVQAARVAAANDRASRQADKPSYNL